ncbi:MAG TPA: ATP-binding cassette domain-containing protein [Galbitalea sp.]|nr:ATP-binding cassette domain-containing protein [Galbitalea sp.]
MPLIQISTLSKTYQSDVDVMALRDINLVIYPGEFVAIVGPSGAGKSTLLNILGLLESHTAGEYLLVGRNVKQLSESDRDELRGETFGFVFQDAHVLREDSVARNVALGLRIAGVRLTRQIEIVAALLSRLGIASRANQNAGLLSGGERQRLAIARALANSPSIILADEPTGNLDSKNTHAVMDILLDLNREGTTVVVITHDAEVASIASRQVSIVDGQIGESAIIKDVIRDPTSHSGGEVAAHQGAVRRWATAFVEALSTLTLKPGRSLLLATAFMLGVGGLVAAVGVSESAAHQISNQIAASALDELSFTLPDDAQGPEGLADDESAILRIAHLPGVVLAGVQVEVAASDANVSLLRPNDFDGQPSFDGPVAGATTSFLDLEESKVAPENAPALLNSPIGQSSVILGRDAARQLGVAVAPLGRQIWVAGQRLTVIGVLSRSSRDAELEDSVIVPAQFASMIAHSESETVVRTLPGYPAPLAEAVPLAIDPGSPGRVSVTTVADLRNLRRGVASNLGTLIAIVGGVLLCLGCLTASTLMFLSVSARTPEIALRRAFGASKSTIRLMFVSEGLIVGLAGGLAGAALGLLTVVLACLAQGWEPVESVDLIWQAALAGMLAGALSSILPATRAASVEPSQAIRA